MKVKLLNKISEKKKSLTNVFLKNGMAATKHVIKPSMVWGYNVPLPNAHVRNNKK